MPCFPFFPLFSGFSKSSAEAKPAAKPAFSVAGDDQLAASSKEPPLQHLLPAPSKEPHLQPQHLISPSTLLRPHFPPYYTASLLMNPNLLGRQNYGE